MPNGYRIKRNIILSVFTLATCLLAACASATETRLPPTAMPLPQEALPTKTQITPPAWTAKLSAAINAAPIVSGELVIAATADGAVHATRGQTGESAWVYAPASKVWDASVNADAERVCGGMEGKQVFCLDARTGQPLWMTAVSQEVQSRVALNEERVFAPTTWAGSGMVTDFNGRASLFALDAASGEIIWEAVTENYILRRPSVSGDTVLVGGAYQVDGQPAGTIATRIYAFSVADGSELWKYESDDGLLRWVEADDKIAAFSAATETVYALDLKEGKLLWERGPGYWMQFPAMQDGKIFFGSGDEIFQALDALSGQKVWQQSIEMSSLNQIGRPFIRGERVWFNAVTGEIYALDLATGEIIQHMTTGHSSRVGGALFGDFYILGDPDGNLYAYAIQ